MVDISSLPREPDGEPSNFRPPESGGVESRDLFDYPIDLRILVSYLWYVFWEDHR